MNTEAELPEGAKLIAMHEDGGYRLGIAEVAGVPLLFGLQGEGDPYSVTRLFFKCRKQAKDLGYESLFLDTSNPAIMESAAKAKFRVRTVVMELKL